MKREGWIKSAKFLLLVVGLIIAGAALLVGVFVASVMILDEPPYRMAFRGVASRTVVRFEQPGRSLVSPDFPVNIPVPTPTEFVLDDYTPAIPGCTIVFADTAPLPGRFQIRIGATLFDVMEARVIVAGQEFGWQPR